MPTVVPRRGEGYVQSTPGPQVRPGDAFKTPAPIDITGFAKQAVELYAQAREKADQVVLLDADNKLATLSTDLETQAQSLRGKDALNAHTLVDEGFSAGIDEIRKSLTNDRQRQAFENRIAGRHQALYASVAQHTRVEMQKQDAQTTDAAIAIRLNDAVANFMDPAKIGQAVSEIRAINADYGKRNGFSADQTKEKQASDVSKAHAAVIARMLAKGQDLTAAKYYAAVSDQIVGSDSIQIEKQLELGSLRGESQRQADKIVATSATMSSALAQVRAIQDPQVRDAAREQVIHYYEDQATSQRLERQETFQRAGEILEQTGSVRSIPPADWLKLSVEDRAALQRREDRIHGRTEGGQPKGNSDTYISLLNMAGLSDATRAQFETTDLTQYRSKMSENEFKELLHLQLGERRQTSGALSGEARRQAASGERDLKKERERAAARETLRSLGIDIPATVPGAPLRTPAAAPLRASPKGKQVPQAWLDRASRDENYKRYLEHMGVIFENSAPSTRIQSDATHSSGDIQLK